MNGDRETPDLTDLTRTVRTKITPCACSCWVWTGSTDTSGYAKMKMRNRMVIVHRYVFDQYNPDEPLDGYDDTVDHLCDRHRLCLNPTHMERVSRSENSRRANERRWRDVDVDASSCSLSRSGEPLDEPTTP